MATLPITNQENIWDHFEKKWHFLAKCKYCAYEDYYITPENFEQHIRNNHNAVWQYEDVRTSLPLPWSCFKYFNILYSECLICGEKFQRLHNVLVYHLNYHNNIEQFIFSCIFSRENWPKKYWTQKEDFSVECSLCHDICNISINTLLYDHISSHHEIIHPALLQRI